jgi:transketolase
MLRAHAYVCIDAKRTIAVLTHDSIGQGEDGPTHQPVENTSGCVTFLTYGCVASS